MPIYCLIVGDVRFRCPRNDGNAYVMELQGGSLRSRERGQGTLLILSRRNKKCNELFAEFLFRKCTGVPASSYAPG
jgi:hypothetical protein